jgi:predicted small secreted protein
MRCQLEHLARESARPNVTLQVLPMAAGEHPGMEGSFVLMSFPDAADPDTVYVTIATGGVFQEKPDDVSRYEIIFDRLQKMALSSAESAEFIATMAKEP